MPPDINVTFAIIPLMAVYTPEAPFPPPPKNDREPDDAVQFDPADITDRVET